MMISACREPFLQPLVFPRQTMEFTGQWIARHRLFAALTRLQAGDFARFPLLSPGGQMR